MPVPISAPRLRSFTGHADTRRSAPRLPSAVHGLAVSPMLAGALAGSPSAADKPPHAVDQSDPLAEVLGGRYGLVHGWTAVLADRALPLNRLFAVRYRPRQRPRAGVAWPAGSGGQDAHGRHGQPTLPSQTALSLGAGGQFTDNRDTWSLLRRVGFFWRARSHGQRGAPPRGDDSSRIEAPAPPPPLVPQPVVAPGPTPSVEIQGTPCGRRARRPPGAGRFSASLAGSPGA